MSQCLTDEDVLAFVAGALGSPKLDEVHAHLDGCDDCRQLTAEAAKAHFETTEPRRLPELTGRTVERYRILRAIGAGGMGIVYLAEDSQLHRKVALKFLRASTRADAAEDQHRLLDEARAMARLAHPNVVGVYEAGTYQDQVFVAMEFVDGITLKQWLRLGARSWREILDKIRDAGRGLAAAHAAGLVHRDFKPDNVLVDDEGRVRVGDFGLARPVRAPEHDLAASQGGTPAYMAPEQVRGEPVDERSDQFSFCVTLYEALYGQRPYPGTSEQALGRAGSGRELVAPASGARVPRWLRRAIERGLRAAPGDRHPAMQDLLARLTPQRSARRRFAMSSALVVCTIVAGIALTRLLGDGRGPPPRPASTGRCAPPPSNSCAPDEFCSFVSSNSCGVAGEPGTCAVRPRRSECAAVSKPVCGCDGKTYDNLCIARAAGTGWDHRGECRVCDVGHPAQCGAKQFCRLPDGDRCGAAGSQGICSQRSSECSLIDDPVCGCDGTTYHNTCEAHAIGVNILRKGRC